MNGTITYCNESFKTISGYEEYELIGKSHNIVRHSDTPAFVFHEAWASIRDDRPWHSVIKNRHMVLKQEKK